MQIKEMQILRNQNFKVNEKNTKHLGKIILELAAYIAPFKKRLYQLNQGSQTGIKVKFSHLMYLLVSCTSSTTAVVTTPIYEIAPLVRPTNSNYYLPRNVTNLYLVYSTSTNIFGRLPVQLVAIRDNCRD